MPQIQVLDEQTIDKIAAGEVVERPSSVVKELVENAIDAKATSITVEIKDGGITLIRITDNGQGIPKEQVPTAFLRHATSKIRSVDDLLGISSLGFRGEALSSIAAVAQVEVITKVPTELTGTKYVIEGAKEHQLEDIGAPDGTTFLVRNLFYNTPARKKFLKSAQTEGTYISAMMEHLALSHPDVSFQFIVNNQPKLHTNGNSNVKDIIYHIYGRDIASGVLPIHYECELFSVDGYVGKPFIARGNRNYEAFFINGRYIKSNLLSKSVEDAYKPYLMKHQYPFVVLLFHIDGNLIDINVHPQKLEIRFSRSEEFYQSLLDAIGKAIEHKDIVPEVPVKEESRTKASVQPAQPRRPEPFEKERLAQVAKAVSKDSPYELKYQRTGMKQTAPFEALHNTDSLQKEDAIQGNMRQSAAFEGIPSNNHQEQNAAQAYSGQIAASNAISLDDPSGDPQQVQEARQTVKDQLPSSNGGEEPFLAESKARTLDQLTLAEQLTYNGSSPHADFIKEAKRRNYTLIGQLFDTYWLLEVEQELFIIDQHAAHEKVMYEKLMAQLANKELTSQQLFPPLVVTLNMQEEQLLKTYGEQFAQLGYEISAFGGREYTLNAVPANLYSLNSKELFLELLDELSLDTGKKTPTMILDKIASMSCKAAVKGNQHLSRAEAERLLEDLMQLENPYNCPHGRPTIIAMSKTELEKKFKRIV